MIWKRNGGNITFISKRGKPMYEKDFLKLMPLLPHSKLVNWFLAISNFRNTII